MLNRFMDSDGDYDGVDQPRRQPFQWKWYHPLIAVAVLFPYISIFALFGVVSNQKTSNHYYVSIFCPPHLFKLNKLLTRTNL